MLDVRAEFRIVDVIVCKNKMLHKQIDKKLLFYRRNSVKKNVFANIFGLILITFLFYFHFYLTGRKIYIEYVLSIWNDNWPI